MQGAERLDRSNFADYHRRADFWISKALVIVDINLPNYLITGDKKHLLPLKHWEKTIIISPSDFIKIIKVRFPKGTFK